MVLVNLSVYASHPTLADTNDPLASGAIDYAIEHGVRIPEDLAIIGCGNLHYDDSLRVGLSSIDQHSRRIGEAAARLTLGILSSRLPPTPETVILQPELIVRASTGRQRLVPRP